MEGDVFEEADFEADRDDLPQIGDAGEVLAAGAEVGKGKMAGPGELQPAGDERGIEVESSPKLNFKTELQGGGGESLAVEDPASTVGEG